MSERPIAFDTVLDLCDDRNRRIVLAVLAEERRSLTVNDLRSKILAQSHQRTVSNVSEETRTKIRLSLCHTHVPKLESAGVVEYDPERQLVEPTDRFDRLEPHLSAILEADPELEEPIAL